MPELDYKINQTFEYKTITISPDGIRGKGDDISDKIADLLNDLSNKYGRALEVNFYYTIYEK
jgi:hypothetical protein